MKLSISQKEHTQKKKGILTIKNVQQNFNSSTQAIKDKENFQKAKQEDNRT